MAEVFLKIDRLASRRIQPGDVALKFRLLNTPAVMNREGGAKTSRRIEAGQQKALAQLDRDGFGVVRTQKASGKLVSRRGLKGLDHEIGWLVCENLNFGNPDFPREDNPMILYSLTPAQREAAK